MIKNLTKKTIVSRHEKYCSSLLSKLKGLMFSFKVKTLILQFNKEKVHSLHMWFVFYPIDVLFLDKQFKVVEIKKNFKSFTCYTPKVKSKIVIELPLGRVEKSKTKIGDILLF